MCIDCWHLGLQQYHLVALKGFSAFRCFQEKMFGKLDGLKYFLDSSVWGNDPI